MKRAVSAGLLALLMFAFCPVAYAHAVSTYDDFYHTTDQLMVGSEVCTDVDLTYSLEQHITNPANWSYNSSTQYQWIQDETESLETAITSGSWGVSQMFGHNTNGGMNLFGAAVVFWTEDSSMRLQWGMSNGGEVKAYSTNGSSALHSLIIQNEGLRFGDSRCGVKVMPYGSSGLLSTYVQSTPTVYGDRVLSNLFTSMDTIIYPSGYEGQFIRTTPPMLVTNPYTGTVDCGGEDPLSVGIYQSGNNGTATLTPLSLGRAQWSYNLTSDPYGIQVLCGDELAVSPGIVLSSTTSGDWVCDIYGENPHFCVLS